MKKITSLTIFGFIVGEFIGFWFSIVFSLLNHVAYVPAPSSFMANFSNTTLAVASSAILWGLIGVVFSVTSLIFTREHWSITRMTISHFLITLFSFTPLAILCGWFPLQILSLLFFFIIFCMIYLVMWLIFMRLARKDIAAINTKLKQ